MAETDSELSLGGPDDRSKAQQAAAIAGILRYGGYIYTPDHPQFIELQNSRATDESVELLRFVDTSHATALYLDSTAITDRAMAVVQKMARLKELGLASTRITDAGLQLIAQLTHSKILGWKTQPSRMMASNG